MLDIAEQFMAKWDARAISIRPHEEHLRILEKDYGMTVLEFSETDRVRFLEVALENWREVVADEKENSHMG